MTTIRVPPKNTAEEDVAKLGAADIVELASEFKPGDLDEESLFHYRYELLRRLVREDERLLWQAISEQPQRLDRHRMVWDLWTKLVEPEGRLTEHHHSKSYHLHYMFDWFLERYDLARARAVYVTSGFTCHIHWVLLPLLLMCVWARASNPLVPWLVPLLYAGCVFLLWASGRRGLLPLGQCVQTFIPRLAGTTVVGYLFLAAAADLVKYISRRPWYIVTAVCVAVSFGYLLLEMGHRLHPQPRARIMLGRALDMLCVGACHSLALIAMGGSALAEIVEIPASTSLLLSWAALILLIGLVLNVIWAEEPVTHPL